MLKGHPCADGNKRLALILTDAFLEANGCEVEATAVALDQKFRHAAASPSSEWEATVLELQEWFGEIMRPLTEEA